MSKKEAVSEVALEQVISAINSVPDLNVGEKSRLMVLASSNQDGDRQAIFDLTQVSLKLNEEAHKIRHALKVKEKEIEAALGKLVQFR